MTNVIYWLDVDGDRTGLELVVNGVPAERLRTHALRIPINEYLLPGANHVLLRRSLWPSNKEDGEGGEAGLKLTRATYRTSLKLGEQVVGEQTAAFTATAGRSPLVMLNFSADPAPAPPPLGVFDPIGPAGRAMILDQLAAVAAMWRSGDGARLVEWMSRYLDDYGRAYPLESRADMEHQVVRMAEAFRGDQVEFDRNQTLLDPVPGSNLVDCLSPRGAAVRVARAGGPDYDMWAVVGIRGGEVMLVR